MSSYGEKIQLLGASGGRADVVNNSLQVRPNSRFQQAVKDGRAFSWSAVTANWAAGATVIGLENNDTANDLYIERIEIASDTASSAPVFTASGIAVAGTNAVPAVNLNRASGRVAKATAFDAETGQNEAGTSWLGRIALTQVAADVPTVLQLSGALVLPNDFMVAVDFVADAGAGNVTIWGWFEAAA